ncbi:ATP-binding protein [Aquabacterium sp.]|uniref:ATP-binding protein n=1 Tax=Aquabacterium sp. TaxID=1872578 RepID=UPI0035AEC46A
MSDKLTKLSWLEELYALSQTAASATVLEEALTVMLRHIADGFSAGSGTLALIRADDQGLEIAAGTDLPREAIGQHIALGQGVLGRVAQGGEPVLINGALDASQTSRPSGPLKRKVPSSSMCWPLSIKGRIMGAFSMNRFDDSAPFESRDLQRGSIMANMVALVIENLRMHREQQQRIAHLSELNQRLADVNRQLADTQTQLLQQEKMASIGQLAAGVAHEINNPIGFASSNLRTLSNYVEQLLARIQADHPGPALGEDLQYVADDAPVLIRETREGLERVRRIVQDLRDFSRVDAGEQWEMADLNAAVRSTVNVCFGNHEQAASVRLELGEIPLVRCLLSQINQVFHNMLVNASHAIANRPGGEPGVITVRSGAVDAGHVFVDIADNGCGMEPDVLKRIFEPFFTTRPVGQGTGLGLSLAYGIVQKHGGHIEVDSIVGRGSTFRVVLPIRPDSAAEASGPTHV